MRSDTITSAGATTTLAERLFSRYGDDILEYLRYLTGNDADARDLRQDVFFAVSSYERRRGAPPTSERGWLLRIAHNKAVDHWRRTRLRGLFLRFEDAERAEASDPAGTLAIWDAIDRLPFREREAVVLRYRWDLRHSEIAALQGRTEGAVRAQISRALARLRQQLKEV